MFANLNLQLTSLLTSDETGLAGSEDLATAGLEGSEEMLSFSEFFSLSTEEAQRPLVIDREFLPRDGELLPQDGSTLPPAIPLQDALTPDLMTATVAEPAALPELSEPSAAGPLPGIEVRSSAALPDVEPADIELELSLNYTGNEIPAEIPVLVPEESLVLPPGLQLTAISPGLQNASRISPEDQRVALRRELRPVMQVSSAASLATAVAPLEAAEELIELAGPQAPVAPLPRDRRPRIAPQAALTAPVVVTDTSQAGNQKPVVELPELLRPVAAIEPQRQPDSGAKALPPGPPIAAAQMAAAPSSAAGDLSALRTDLTVETISTPVRGPGWGEKLAERVVMLAGVQTRTAEIRLTPAELGPLRVQISVDDGQANVAFQAHNAITREAIEQALPRLREMLAESGLSLGQADVGEQGVAERERDGDSASDGASEAQGDTPDEHAGSSEGERQKTVISNGLVDTFA